MNGHEIPVSCRVLFRNPVTNLRADMNGLDLYTVRLFDLLKVRLSVLYYFQSSVIGKDRYVLYRQLKEGILKRSKK